jgi:hypothetical protein
MKKLEKPEKSQKYEEKFFYFLDLGYAGQNMWYNFF